MARVLVLNAGSSSLKASVIELGQREPLAATTTDRRQTVADVLAQLNADGISAVGHRVVHGGLRFREPVLIDERVLGELDELSELAPLHNPVAVETIRAAREALPDVPHVAAFDTAFHATLDEAAYVYPLPWAWHTEWGIRRYGFHGLSVEWSVRRAAELLGRDLAELCLVVAHLGSGCSITAVDGGRCVSTSMGMTPLEGLMMVTRAGSFDPGVAIKLLDDKRVSVAGLWDALEHESGLAGVSGVTGGMREVEQAAAGGNERATLAVEMFCRRAAEGIAAATTALPRLDALIFTGGIGENAASVRERIVGRLGVLGITPSRVPVMVIEAREDLVIADSVAALVG